MLHVPSELQRSSRRRSPGCVLLMAAAVILAALAFEHIGGYDPCPLCLQQRYAYYARHPGPGGGAGPAAAARSPRLAAAILLAVGIGFVVNAGLGVYQAGAEWKFWDPPSTCAAPGGAAHLRRQDPEPRPGAGAAGWPLALPGAVLRRLERSGLGGSSRWARCSSA